MKEFCINIDNFYEYDFMHRRCKKFICGHWHEMKFTDKNASTLMTNRFIGVSARLNVGGIVMSDAVNGIINMRSYTYNVVSINIENITDKSTIRIDGVSQSLEGYVHTLNTLGYGYSIADSYIALNNEVLSIYIFNDVDGCEVFSTKCVSLEM